MKWLIVVVVLHAALTGALAAMVAAGVVAPHHVQFLVQLVVALLSG